MSIDGLINYVIGIVVVLAVLSAMWGTIVGFITCITDLSPGATATLAALIPFFVILAVVLVIIYGAVKHGKNK